MELALELLDLGLVQTELVVELVDLIFEGDVESFHFYELGQDLLVAGFDHLGLADLLVHLVLLLLKFPDGGVEFFGEFLIFGQVDRLFAVDGIQESELVLDGFVESLEDGVGGQVSFDVLLQEDIETVILLDVFGELLDEFTDLL